MFIKGKAVDNKYGTIVLGLSKTNYRESDVINDIALSTRRRMNGLITQYVNSEVHVERELLWVILAEEEDLANKLGFSLEYERYTSEKASSNKPLKIRRLKKITFDPDRKFPNEKYFNGRIGWEKSYRLIYVPQRLIQRFSRCINTKELYVAHDEAQKMGWEETRGLVGIVIGMNNKSIRIRAKSSYSPYSGIEDYTYNFGEDKELDRILSQNYIYKNTNADKFVSKFSQEEPTVSRRINYLDKIIKGNPYNFFNPEYIYSIKESSKYYNNNKIINK